MKKKKTEIIEDCNLLLSHIIIEEGNNDEFIKYWRSLGDTVDIKVMVGDYEINVDSFQDYFMAIWERSKSSENNRVKSMMIERIDRLHEELNQMGDFIENTNGKLIDEVGY